MLLLVVVVAGTVAPGAVALGSRGGSSGATSGIIADVRFVADREPSVMERALLYVSKSSVEARYGSSLDETSMGRRHPDDVRSPFTVLGPSYPVLMHEISALIYGEGLSDVWGTPDDLSGAVRVRSVSGFLGPGSHIQPACASHKGHFVRYGEEVVSADDDRTPSQRARSEIFARHADVIHGVSDILRLKAGSDGGRPEHEATLICLPHRGVVVEPLEVVDISGLVQWTDGQGMLVTMLTVWRGATSVSLPFFDGALFQSYRQLVLHVRDHPSLLDMDANLGGLSVSSYGRPVLPVYSAGLQRLSASRNAVWGVETLMHYCMYGFVAGDKDGDDVDAGSSSSRAGAGAGGTLRRSMEECTGMLKSLRCTCTALGHECSLAAAAAFVDSWTHDTEHGPGTDATRAVCSRSLDHSLLIARSRGPVLQWDVDATVADALEAVWRQVRDAWMWSLNGVGDGDGDDDDDEDDGEAGATWNPTVCCVSPMMGHRGGAPGGNGGSAGREGIFSLFDEGMPEVSLNIANVSLSSHLSELTTIHSRVDTLIAGVHAHISVVDCMLDFPVGSFGGLVRVYGGSLVLHSVSGAGLTAVSGGVIYAVSSEVRVMRCGFTVMGRAAGMASALGPLAVVVHDRSIVVERTSVMPYEPLWLLGDDVASDGDLGDRKPICLAKVWMQRVLGELQFRDDDDSSNSGRTSSSGGGRRTRLLEDVRDAAALCDRSRVVEQLMVNHLRDDEEGLGSGLKGEAGRDKMSKPVGGVTESGLGWLWSDWSTQARSDYSVAQEARRRKYVMLQRGEQRNGRSLWSSMDTELLTDEGAAAVHREVLGPGYPCFRSHQESMFADSSMLPDLVGLGQSSGGVRLCGLQCPTGLTLVCGVMCVAVDMVDAVVDALTQGAVPLSI